jgi:aminomethyltransferase
MSRRRRAVPDSRSIRGPDRIRFIEGLVVSDIAELAKGQTQLSVFTNEKGGIKDDTMITNNTDHLYACREEGSDA